MIQEQKYPMPFCVCIHTGPIHLDYSHCSPPRLIRKYINQLNTIKS